MDIFNYDDYKHYVRDRVVQMPSGGRGEWTKLAQALRIHSTRMSHIFKGSEHLTLEQGFELTRILGLRTAESDFFMDLLQFAKAGTADLKKYYEKKLKDSLVRSQELKTRLPSDRILKDQERAIFYSNWYYSAIRLSTSLPGDHTVDSIARKFSLPKGLVSEVVHFLLATGLCVEKNGKLSMGPSATHLESTSPLISRLHSNWRLKAIEGYLNLGDHGLAYTGPMSIRSRDAAEIRKILVKAIEDAARYSEIDPADSLYCLNVDFFAF